MNTSILDFGAISDGITLNTLAIQNAIDKCAQSGGGRVTIPSGTYKSGTIWLRSNVELHLEMGAVLLASDNLNDYNELDAFPQNSRRNEFEGWVGKHLIIALNVENCSITGLGTVNGNCHAYVDPFYGDTELAKWGWKHGIAILKDKENLRPGQLICFIESKNLSVKDISIIDSPCWSLYFHGCEFVQVNSIRVNNPAWMLNSDGIDIDASRYVTVSDCIILTGDDAITLRACEHKLENKNINCEYVTITNCVLSSSICAFRLGVGQGTIKHARISNIVVKGSHTLAQICTAYSPTCKADMEDINFSNISAKNTDIFVDAFAKNGATMEKVTFDNIRCDCTQENSIRVEKGNIDNFTLKNIELYYPESADISSDDLNSSRSKCPFYINGASNATLDNVKVYGVRNVSDSDIIKANCPKLIKINCNF